MYENFYDNFTEFIFVEDKPEKADVIFVPGNDYPDMAEAAAKLWMKGYAPYVLPSGRYSLVEGKFSGVKKKQDIYPDKYETEWDFLQNVLKNNGVPASQILKEDQATFTYENAIYSKEVLDREGISVKKAIICCRSIHARRCKMYYELLFPETKFYMYPVAAAGITRNNWYQSEEGITTVLDEIERCGSQFREMLKEMQGV